MAPVSFLPGLPSAIGNRQTDPLPRGGTDLIGPAQGFYRLLASLSARVVSTLN